MLIKVVLKEYLDDLRAQEQHKPVHRRRVLPTISELAEAAQVSKPAVNDLLNNANRGINREILGQAIQLLRGRGFQVDVSDLVVYLPGEDDKSPLTKTEANEP